MKNKGYTHCKGSTIVYQKYPKFDSIKTKYICPICNNQTVRIQINLNDIFLPPLECSFCKNRFEKKMLIKKISTL